MLGDDDGRGPMLGARDGDDGMPEGRRDADDQPDVAPGPDVDAGGAGDEVYRAAAQAMLMATSSDEDGLYEWRPCDDGAANSCPGICPCSGIPYPSAAVRAAIDAGWNAARAQPLAELADATRLLETSHEVRTTLAADLAQAILERDVSRVIAEKLVAKMDGGRWLTQMGRDTPTGIEWCRAADDRYGCGPDRQTHEWNHDVRRLRWIGPVEPVTDDGSAT